MESLNLKQILHRGGNSPVKLRLRDLAKVYGNFLKHKFWELEERNFNTMHLNTMVIPTTRKYLFHLFENTRSEGVTLRSKNKYFCIRHKRSVE